MSFFFCIHAGDVELDWPGHVFPVEKYRLLRERLVSERIVLPGEWVEPAPLRREDLLRVHPERYLARLESLSRERSPRAIAEFEAPLSPHVLEAVFRATAGTVEAARRAAEGAFAVHLGGGFHHAFADRGEGFCFVNDVAVAIRAVAASEGRERRVAVVDCDVHQGNGTAAIFGGDSNVFTFSIHQENLYPVKERSSLDVGLPDGTGDEVYLEKLRSALRRIDAVFEPEWAVYLAGADPFEEDRLGGLALSKDGLRERDRAVFGWARSSRIGIATVMAGGYARLTQDVVSIHAETVRAARQAALDPGD